MCETKSSCNYYLIADKNTHDGVPSNYNITHTETLVYMPKNEICPFHFKQKEQLPLLMAR
jgi:hypothetical protein